MIHRDPRLENKWWRITHLYKILDKQGRLITFKPSRVQHMIIRSIGPQLRAKILKYRQGGVTTLFCIDYLDDALWTPGFSAAIIAHERGTLDKIFEIVDRAFENLPASIKPVTDRNTLRLLKFKRTFDGQKLDSQIYVALKLRGGTVQALHITERAFIEGDKSTELEAGSKQAVPVTGRITEETTANGFNEFYDSFMQDYENENPGELDTLALFFAWHQDPQYQIEGELGERTEADIKLDQTVFDNYGYHLSDQQLIWYNWKMKDLEKAARASEDSVRLTGRQLMQQEYPSTVLEAFQSGQGSVFDNELLNQMTAAKPIKAVKSKSNPGETIYIYDEYVSGAFYGLGCDPSDGSGDPAGIAVWSEDYKKVAEWSGLLRPDNLAKLIKEVAELYGDAFAGVENNMLSTVLFLSKIYQNYFITVRVDQKYQTTTKKLGWSTTGKSRDIMIDDFIMHFEEGELANLSKLTINQMKTFVTKEGGKREHAVGKHDDMLFADMIALQMIKHKRQSRHKTRTFARKPQGF